MNKINLALCVLVLGAISCASYAASPVVSNVSAEQRGDASKIVDISYDLAYSGTSTLTVSVKVSNNGGSSYTITPTGLSGAVGSSVVKGTGKKIVWSGCKTDLPGAYASNYKISITASENNYDGEMIYIPAGSFLMGNSGIGNDATYNFSDEFPQHSVTLSAYYISKYEATRGEYRKFINAGGYSNSSYWSSTGWSWKVSGNRTQPYYWDAVQDWAALFGYGSQPFTQTDNHPVVGVSYYEAEAFCTWAGGRLPTEAEWEQASRWNPATNHPNVYPWGDTWNSNYCNNWSDSLYPGYQTSPVGSYSSYGSPSGCQDMLGNVAEWCSDCYSDTYYSTSPSTNPQGPATGNYRVLRGGGWMVNNAFCRCASRTILPDYPLYQGTILGFRIAYDGSGKSGGGYGLAGTGYSYDFTIDNRYGGTGPVSGTPDASNCKRVILLVRGLKMTVGPGRTSNSDEYWKDALDVLRSRFPQAEVRTVGTDIFDGTGRVSDAGQKLAGYVDQWANNWGYDVYIIAHSMGGLVTRDCLSRLSNQGKRGAVKGVFMLATPNCGTHVADVGVSVCGVSSSGTIKRKWLAGQFYIDGNDTEMIKAAWELQTDVVLRARETWNDGNQLYYLFGGTSHMGLNKYSKTNLIHLDDWPEDTDNPNDGVVTAKSAQGICYHWGSSGPYEVQTLQKSNKYSYGLNHEMMIDRSIISVVADMLENIMPTANTSNCSARLMDAVPAFSDIAVIMNSGTVTNSQTNELDVPIDQLSPTIFSLSYSAGGPQFSLVNPDGIVITQTEMQEVVAPANSEDGLGRAVYTINSPKVGHWKLRVAGSSSDTNTDYVVNVGGVSTLMLSSKTASVQSQSNCYVTAQIANDVTAVTGAAVTADCNYPDGSSGTVNLLDDGLHNDGAAGDGVYGGKLISPPTGMYTAVLRAAGTYAGNDFVRISTASFTVSPQTATLNGTYSAQGIDEGGLPGYEKLRVSAGVNVVSGSSFRLYGELADSAGNTIATASTERTDLVTGSNTVALDFDGDALRKSGAAGTLSLTNVSITDLSFNPSLMVLESENVYSFSGFNGSDFVDTTPPAFVNDLSVSSKGANSITLIWTAPDSEGSAAVSYELRMSHNGFSTSTWANGTLITGVPAPAAPGTQQTVTVSGLLPGNYYWFCIRSKDANNNQSELSNLVVTDLTADYTPSLNVGLRTKISGVITAVFPGRIYVEKPNRAYGAAVEIAADDVYTPGQTVDVLGEVALENGEKKLVSTAILPTGTAAVPNPVGVTGKLLGFPIGVGNTGLLVRMWGVVTYLDSEFMYIDDGSHIIDGNKLGAGGSPIIGRKVFISSGAKTYPVGSYVAASGISMRDVVEGASVPVVRMRSTDTIKLLSGATISGRVTHGVQSVTQTIECPHPYPYNYYPTWTINGPANASSIRVHFSRIELLNDYLYVNLPSWSTYESFTGGPYTDVWSNWYTGNQIQISLYSNYGNSYGFQMDKYETEVPGGSSQPMSGVTITLNPGGLTKTTGADGTYSFADLAPGTYTATPNAAGYTFTPASKSVTVVSLQNSIGNDFTKN